MKKIVTIIAALLLAAGQTALSQNILVGHPQMKPFDPERAYRFEGLSSSSAFLLADLMGGKLSEPQLMEKFGLVYIQGEVYVPAFVETDRDESLFAAFGVKIVSRNGKLLRADIPLNAFVPLAQSGSCSWIDVGVKGRPTLEAARAELGIDDIYNGENLPQRYDGSGVVVGIIDIGFEYGHPAFFDSLGTTYRVKRVWDQNATSGTSPAGFNYGREMTTQTEILAARCSHTDQSHGTHVAGIAAGCGGNTASGRRFRGMAPAADIVLVATAMSSSTIFDGIEYIRNYAASHNQPCVINMSIGGHMGPHDGTSSFDRALDANIQARPDSIVVVGSAGNEGSSNIHISKQFPGLDSTLYTFLDFNNNDSYLIDLWGSPNVPFRAGLAVVNVTDGTFADAGYFYNSNLEYVESDTLLNGALRFAVYGGGVSSYNQRQNISIGLEYDLPSSTTYRVCLVVQCDTVASVHGWGTFCTFVDEGFSMVQAGNAEYTVGEIGGTAHSIVSVGAYTTRTSWESITGTTQGINSEELNGLATFSSHGPTLDGRTKPDIAAPGQYILAPYNRFDAANVNGTFCSAYVNFNGNVEYYGAMRGTSMAAPMATGIVALWLQAHPSYGFDSVVSCLHSTARTDIYTGAIPSSGSNLWGWGKINPHGALNYSAPVMYQVTVTSSDPAQGTVSGGGSYPENGVAVITAVAASGYRFDSWDDGNTQNPRTVIVTSDTSFIATFVEGDYQDCPTITNYPWEPEFDDNLTCWRNIDADGDGNLWLRYGDWALSESYSYFSQTNQPLTPDNWLISRPLQLSENAVLSWAAKGMSTQYYTEHYSVYVSTTGSMPSDFTTLLFSETLNNAEQNNRAVSLSAYAGQTVRIAFRHHASDDVFVLGIGGVTVKRGSNGIIFSDDVDAKVTVVGRTIFVETSEGRQPVRIVDILGRTLVDKPFVDPAGYTMPAAGVYMLRIADAPARKIVVR